MKKIIYLFWLFIAAYSETYSQLPSIYNEYTIPPTADVTRANNTYTYKKDKVSLEGSLHTLYLSCWSGGASSGIFWRKGYSGETYLLPEVETASGYVQISATGGGYDFEFVQDLSAVPLRVNNEGRIQVIATFYGAKRVGSSHIYGHYMSVYEWDPTPTGGLVYIKTITLSTATTYGRISLDNYRMQAAVIAWSEGSILKTKLINFLSTGIDPKPTSTIIGFTGYLPDVAIQARPSGAGSLTTIYYLFLNSSTLYPYVVKTDMSGLFSSSPTFSLIDINPDAFPPSWTTGALINAYPTGYDDIIDHSPGDNLQLSCPEISPNDSWAYVYTNNLHDVKLRRAYAPSYPVTTIPITSGDLVDPGVVNQQLTIWVNNSNDVFTGWRSNVLSDISGMVWTYIGNMFNLSTGPSTSYSIISNENFAVSSISFQGQDNEADFSDLYCSYVYDRLLEPDCEIDEEEDCIIDNYFLMYKFKPFSPMAQFNYEASMLPQVSEVKLYPNPVRNQLSLAYNGMYTDLFKVEVYNMEGKVITTLKGTISNIEQQLQSYLSSMVSGNYLLSFLNTESHEQQTINLVKE